MGSAAIGSGLFCIGLMLPEVGPSEEKVVVIGVLLLIAGAVVTFGGFLVLPKVAADGDAPEAPAHSVFGSASLLATNLFVLCGLEVLAIRLVQHFAPAEIPYGDEMALALAALCIVVGAGCTNVGVVRLIRNEVKMSSSPGSCGTDNAQRHQRGLAGVWSGFTLSLISIFMPLVVSVSAIIVIIRSMRILAGFRRTQIVAWLGLVIACLTLTVVPLVIFAAVAAAIIH
jgi:hypothetical protein